MYDEAPRSTTGVGRDVIDRLAKPSEAPCPTCQTPVTAYEGIYSYQRRTGITLDVVGGSTSMFQGAGYRVHYWWCWRGYLERLWMAAHPRYFR